VFLLKLNLTKYNIVSCTPHVRQNAPVKLTEIKNKRMNINSITTTNQSLSKNHKTLTKLKPFNHITQ